MEQLYILSNRLVENVSMTYQRYLNSVIDWNEHLIGIRGSRGVGKTTLILQHIQANGWTAQEALYVSLDHVWFTTHSLLQLTEYHYLHGGKYLFLDEIHRYPNWIQELKNISDYYPQMYVVFTGSSLLRIDNTIADLSRRCISYTMQGLSFREYLEMYHQVSTPVYTLDDIINHKVELPKIAHPLPLFREYLKSGYYPFAVEGDFEQRMMQVVSQTVESDIPQYADMKISTTRKLKRMLSIISSLAPYKPNTVKLAEEIGVSKNNIPDYLYYLERAGMIGQLRDDTGGMRGLGKVDKVYIDNPSLMTILSGGTPDIGNLRETFFYNQMRVNNDVISSRVSDFAIGSYTFEVGGHKKGSKQLEGIPNGIVVRDDIETGHGIFVPLWQFGLNY